MDGFFMQYMITGGLKVLKVLNLQTGQKMPLVPSDQVLQNSTTAPYLTNYTAPFYSPAAHQLVFTARDSSGSKNVWIAPVTFANDGWPTLSAPPTVLVPCDVCGNRLYSD